MAGSGRVWACAFGTGPGFKMRPVYNSAVSTRFHVSFSSVDNSKMFVTKQACVSKNGQQLFLKRKVAKSYAKLIINFSIN